MPASSRAWLVSAGRFKAIDQLRRQARFQTLGGISEPAAEGEQVCDGELLEDDRLRLVFTCCHPALAFEAQTALTLREVCDLITEEIARSFLVTPSTIAQRIVRAKSKIHSARIPYELPEGPHDSECLNYFQSVQQSALMLAAEPLEPVASAIDEIVFVALDEGPHEL